jgi:hypothetical protein
MHTTMNRPEKIEQLYRALDEANACAEEAGLRFVVLLLEMARLEVDESTKNNVLSMPGPRSLGKRT